MAVTASLACSSFLQPPLSVCLRPVFLSPRRKIRRGQSRSLLYFDHSSEASSAGFRSAFKSAERTPLRSRGDARDTVRRTRATPRSLRRTHLRFTFVTPRLIETSHLAVVSGFVRRSSFSRRSACFISRFGEHSADSLDPTIKNRTRGRENEVERPRSGTDISIRCSEISHQFRF